MNGSSGTIILEASLDSRLGIVCTGGFGFAEARVDFAVTLTAPADNYQFSGYPNSPPAGTVPYAQNAADTQRGPLADGSGCFVDGRVNRNQDVNHAYQRLRQAGIFFVFGHGGSNMQSCQTFWDGTN
jgi:hypothetical protein